MRFVCVRLKAQIKYSWLNVQIAFLFGLIMKIYIQKMLTKRHLWMMQKEHMLQLQTCLAIMVSTRCVLKETFIGLTQVVVNTHK